MPAASSGGGSGDVRAGGAFYEIVGKDGLSATMGKLQGKVAGFTKFVGGAFGGAFLGGLLGGSLSSKLSELGEALGESFQNAVFGANRLRTELDKILASGPYLAKMFEVAARRGDDWLGTVVDRESEIARLNKEIEAASKAGAAAISAAGAEQEKLAGLKKFDLAHIGRSIGGEQGEALAQVEERIKALGETATKASTRIADLTEKRDRLMKPTSNPALVGDLNRAIEQMRVESMSLFQTPGEKLRAQFERRGATENQLMELDAASRALQLAQMENEVRTLYEQLNDAREFAGRTAEEIAVLKLERKGLGVEDSAKLRSALPSKAPPWLSMALTVAGMTSTVADRLKVAASEVRGMFGGDMRSFGYGSQGGKDLQEIKNNTEPNQLADKIGKAVVNGLRFT